jgi:hypothetical protein
MIGSILDSQGGRAAEGRRADVTTDGGQGRSKPRRRRWLDVLEVLTVAAVVVGGIAIAVLDMVDLLDPTSAGNLRQKVPAITLLLLGLVGGQLAFERYRQLRNLQDNAESHQQQLDTVAATVQELGPKLEQVRDSVAIQPGDARFDSALREVSLGLQSALKIDNDVFSKMIYRHLAGFRDRVTEWRDGTFRTRGEEYHRLLLDLYRSAQNTIVSTSASAYQATWHSTLGDRLLAAHATGRAKVERIFVFNRREEITEDAIEEMRRQSRVRNVSIYVYIKDADPFFRFPADVSDDFTMVDDGEVIGTTLTFGDESNLTANWYFRNPQQARKFKEIVDALRSGSKSLAAFEAEIAAGEP